MRLELLCLLTVASCIPEKGPIPVAGEAHGDTGPGDSPRDPFERDVGSGRAPSDAVAADSEPDEPSSDAEPAQEGRACVEAALVGLRASDAPMQPTLAVAPDRVAVAWRDADAVWLGVYDLEGAALVDPRPIASSSVAPALVTTPDGFAAAWAQADADGARISVQRLDRLGRADQPTVMLGNPAVRLEGVALGADGEDVLVAWTSSSVWYARIGLEGVVGAPRALSEPVPMSDRVPSMAVDADGAAVVAWGHAEHAWLRRVDRDGVAGPLLDLGRAGNHVRVAVWPGGYALAWTSAEERGALEVTLHTRDGARVGTPIVLGNAARVPQAPDLTWADGVFVVAWDMRAFADRRAVFLRIDPSAPNESNAVAFGREGASSNRVRVGWTGTAFVGVWETNLERDISLEMLVRPLGDCDRHVDGGRG